MATATHTTQTTYPSHTRHAPILLTVQGLTVRYNGDVALDAVSFSIHAGDRVAIIGPNGAGKSTLMQAIMGLIQPQSGRVAIADPGISRLGYVPQHQDVNWDFPVTVRDVVMMGRIRRIGWLRWPRKSDWAAVDAALARVQMTDLARRQIGELSGGQRQRVFIARALVQDVDTLLLDEPFSGVDVGAQSGLLAVLDTLHRDGLTILFSTHDLSLAFQRFDTVIALRGRLIASGTPPEVYTPETLTALYGGRVALVGADEQVTMFVDDPGCDCC